MVCELASPWVKNRALYLDVLLRIARAAEKTVSPRPLWDFGTVFSQRSRPCFFTEMRNETMAYSLACQSTDRLLVLLITHFVAAADLLFQSRYYCNFLPLHQYWRCCWKPVKFPFKGKYCVHSRKPSVLITKSMIFMGWKDYSRPSGLIRLVVTTESYTWSLQV